MRSSIITIAAATACLLTARHLFGQFGINWHTLDGGGAGGPTASIDGAFEVSGTIGQPDASTFALPMSGGTFEVVGGFWVVAVPSCACPGDLNADGLRNGRDIHFFIGCLLAGSNCSCGNLDGTGGVDLGDVDVLVADLLNDIGC